MELKLMLYMLTSHPKDHDRSGGSSRLGILFSLLLTAFQTQADVQPEHVAPLVKLSPTIGKQLKALLVNRFEKDEQLPGPGPIVSGYERSIRVSSGSTSVWLTPVQVRYKSLTNSYCRLAVSDEHIEKTQLVLLPPTALGDSCVKINSQFLIDANETGATDIVQSVRVRSNRGDYGVSDALVYLAHPQSESGYCFSSQASRALSPANLRAASTINAALRNTRLRLGLKEFSCDIQS